MDSAVASPLCPRLPATLVTKLWEGWGAPSCARRYQMNVLLKQIPRPPGVGDSVTHEDEVGTNRKYRHKRLLKTHFKKKKTTCLHWLGMWLSGTVSVFHAWGPRFDPSPSHPQQRKKAWRAGPRSTAPHSFCLPRMHAEETRLLRLN